MRKFLDLLYNSAGALAAIFMIGCLFMVLASVAGRLIGFNLRGSDAYAGYAMAAAGFLALAHTLKRGEHIRVTLVLERLSASARHRMELVAHAIALFFSGVFAWFSVRLAYQSFIFNDISQGNDATPLWIPQIAMALGAIVLFVALADELALLATGHKQQPAEPSELKLME
jgi:TRAP-type C4-dicarboxylate transport system permease small subunit